MSHVPVSKRARCAALWLGMVAAGVLVGCSGDDAPPTPRADLPNVLLVTIDTLRVDRLGLYGAPATNSPRMDTLADEGTFFGRVQAPRGLTWPALTTLMTGSHPRTHKVRVNGTMLEEEFATLPEVLKAAGYETGGFIANMCDAPNRGLDTFFCAWWEKDGPPAEPQRRSWATHEQPAWDAAITREADEFIRASRQRPFFAWVHYLDPHKPYDVVEAFVRDEYDGSFLPDEEVIDPYTIQGRRLSAREREQMLAVYDSQVSATDAHIGGLLDTLDELDLDENTLVILTTDHGEELGDHNAYFYHLASVYQQVLSVPLLLRWPGRVPSSRTVSDEIHMIDIAPTVLEMLDLEPPSTVEGVSRLGLVEGRPGARGADIVFSEWQDQMVIVGQGPWRFIWNPNEILTQGRPFGKVEGAGFVIGREELFNLDDDPLQLRNIAGDHPERVKDMVALACEFVREKPFHREFDAAIPAGVQKRLEALGYIQDTDVVEEELRLINKCAESP